MRKLSPTLTNQICAQFLLHKDKSKLKVEIQNVKLHFLTEKPAREYLNKSADITDNISQSDESHAQLRIENRSNKEQVLQENSNANALVPYDSSKMFRLLIEMCWFSSYLDDKK